MHYHFQMRLTPILMWAAAVAGREFSSGPALQLDTRQDMSSLTMRGVNYSQLGQVLSKNAQIYLPGSSDFNSAVARWSNLSSPTANVVVVPGTEHDIVETVKFANQHSIPFLTTNGAHGSITTLGKMCYGIEIYMSQLSTVTVAKDGKTATIGGGVIAKNLTDALWAVGKQTVTGTCECVSYLGPGLGGGHGWLQGHYGLVSDQFVSMNVVLANGSLISVDQHSELFWAMRGAGHNFGIVTSVTSKVYDLVHPNYAIETLIFRGDQVEAVYGLANELWYLNGKTMPVDLINWSYWYFDPTTDTEGPVIAMYLIQEGVSTVDNAYTQPFLNLKPISNQSLSGTYRDLAAWTGISLGDTPCQKTGNANPRFPIYLKSYNTTAQAQVYDLFRQATTSASSPFGYALFMFEGYPQQGVKAINDDATAFAYRADNILAAPLLSYKPAGPAVDAAAHKLGNQIRDVLFAASGEESLNTYVNYAFGDETPKAWYGDEAWRQERLHALKEDFDPRAKFSFYAPII